MHKRRNSAVALLFVLITILKELAYTPGKSRQCLHFSLHIHSLHGASKPVSVFGASLRQANNVSCACNVQAFIILCQEIILTGPVNNHHHSHHYNHHPCLRRRHRHRGGSRDRSRTRSSLELVSELIEDPTFPLISARLSRN